MLRADLAAARRAWLKEALNNLEEYLRREESDFLRPENHEGESLDFHCLRHTCGAWLAMTGVHPKVVQTVLRHSTITLTMDTYGHLFPGQEADAVARMRGIMNPDLPEVMRATGTDGAIAGSASAQRASRERDQWPALQCNDIPSQEALRESTKSLQLVDLGDDVQPSAMVFASSGGGIRTPDTRIMIPLL
jgi:hypothetical protein